MKAKNNYAKGIVGSTIELSATELQVLKTKMQAIDADAKAMERNEINQDLLINLREMSTFVHKICGKEISSLQEAEEELFGFIPMTDEEVDDLMTASSPDASTRHLDDYSASDEERMERKDRTTDV